MVSYMEKKTTFADLPTELRLMIWEHAIWNPECLPEAHFFKATPIGIEDEEDIARGLNGETNWSFEGYCNFRSLCWDPSEPDRLNWTSEKNMISGYVQNTGLWNACVESRRVLVGVWKNTDRYGGQASCLQADTRSYKVPDDDGRYFYLLFHPSKDLICMDTAHLGGLDDHGWSELAAPFHKNFGFTYDPAFWEQFRETWIWSDRLGEGWYSNQNTFDLLYYRENKARTIDHLMEHLIRFCKHNSPLSEPVKIWLIDHRLRPPATQLRLDEASTGPEGRAIFRAKDRYLVQVRDVDIRPQGGSLTAVDEPCWTLAAECWQDFGDGRMMPDCLAVAQYIRDYTERLGNVDEGSYSPWEFDYCYRTLGQQVGVLACVMDE